MTEVLFYHLTESTLEEALPGLLEKSVQRGWRAVVQTGTEERRDALDAHLWTFREDSFLAHGTDREPHAAEQPVLLTTEAENGNDAEIRFIVDGATPPDVHVRRA
jgi:DNA polymerase-3 subunit chi